MRTASFTDKHFLKDVFAQWQSEISQTEKPFAFLKDAAEIAAVLLLCAFLFVGASLWTLNFLELIILLIEKIFFFPPLFDMRITGVEFTGLSDFIVSMGF